MWVELFVLEFNTLSESLQSKYTENVLSARRLPQRHALPQVKGTAQRTHRLGLRMLHIQTRINEALLAAA